MFLLVLGFGALTVFDENGILEYRHMVARQRALEHEAFELQQQNDELRRRIRLLESDHRYIEKIARKRLHMIRPNEIIYEIPPAH